MKSLKDVHIKGKFDVILEAIVEMFIAAHNLRLVDLCPFASPSEYKLPKSGREEIEKFQLVQICC